MLIPPVEVGAEHSEHLWHALGDPMTCLASVCIEYGGLQASQEGLRVSAVPHGALYERIPCGDIAAVCEHGEAEFKRYSVRRVPFPYFRTRQSLHRSSAVTSSVRN